MDLFYFRDKEEARRWKWVWKRMYQRDGRSDVVGNYTLDAVAQSFLPMSVILFSELARMLPHGHLHEILSVLYLLLRSIDRYHTLLGRCGGNGGREKNTLEGKMRVERF